MHIYGYNYIYIYIHIHIHIHIYTFKDGTHPVVVIHVINTCGIASKERVNHTCGMASEERVNSTLMRFNQDVRSLK